MMNFSLALSVYLVIGFIIAAYEVLTMPKLDKEDEKDWNNDPVVGKYMSFPKNPKLFFFCIITLGWPLYLAIGTKKEGKNDE